jgi:hypothetical protein
MKSPEPIELTVRLDTDESALSALMPERETRSLSIVFRRWRHLRLVYALLERYLTLPRWCYRHWEVECRLVSYDVTATDDTQTCRVKIEPIGEARWS